MLKAVITTLLLGTSTVAMADTPYSYSQQPYYDNRYDDRHGGHYDDRFDRRDFRRNRILLAENVIIGSRDQRTLWVPIDARLDISRLRVRLDGGRTFIQSVSIVYADGHRETMDVRRMLSADQPTLTIDLAHPGVRGVLIDSAAPRQARWGGWRRSHIATVDVIGLRR